jgi:hypothetical protein
MRSHRALCSSVLISLLVLVVSQRRSIAHAEWAGLPATSDACSLLTTAEVSTALEIKSLPGKFAIAGSPKACVWSDTPEAGPDSRRVTLSITSSTVAFNNMKSSPRITTEPASGVGDEAFYALPSAHETPILQIRKGTSVLALRILNGFKSKPFALADVKTKEASLGRAAAGRFQALNAGYRQMPVR